MFACKHLTVIREIIRLASENDSVSLERKKGEKVAKKARIKALDGIKALAIFGVVVYHMGLRFLPSGHMGSFSSSFSRGSLSPPSSCVSTCARGG